MLEYRKKVDLELTIEHGPWINLLLFKCAFPLRDLRFWRGPQINLTPPGVGKSVDL